MDADTSGGGLGADSLATGAAARPLRLIDLREVCKLVSLSKTAVYDAMHRGAFPKSTELWSRTVRWSEPEVLDWIQAKLGARHGSSQPTSAVQ